MNKDLTTIIEEILPKEKHDHKDSGETRISAAMYAYEQGYNQAISDIRNKIPQLVEEIVEEIEAKRRDAEKHPMKYSDDTEMKHWNAGYDHALRGLIKSLTGKNI